MLVTAHGYISFDAMPSMDLSPIREREDPTPELQALREQVQQQQDTFARELNAERIQYGGSISELADYSPTTACSSDCHSYSPAST
jgi:hypothetical protein